MLQSIGFGAARWTINSNSPARRGEEVRETRNEFPFFRVRDDFSHLRYNKPGDDGCQIIYGG